MIGGTFGAYLSASVLHGVYGALAGRVEQGVAERHRASPGGR
jgi:hypothetical protein